MHIKSCGTSPTATAPRATGLTFTQKESTGRTSRAFAYRAEAAGDGPVLVLRSCGCLTFHHPETLRCLWLLWEQKPSQASQVYAEIVLALSLTVPVGV